MALPEDNAILIVAVEVEDVLTFGETCTPRVEAAIPCALQVVMDEIASSFPDSEAVDTEA